MSRIQLFALGSEGRTYLDHTLRFGNSLATGLLERIRSSEGLSFALLPPTATKSQALAFGVGGLGFPDDFRRAFTAPENARGGFLVIHTILASLANALSRRTNARLLVAVDANAESTDPGLASVRSRMFFWGREVFHYAAASPISETDALYAIAGASAAWSGVVAVSPNPHVGWPPGPDRRITTVAALSNIAETATLVASAAYDIEGYVFWMPTDTFPELLSILGEWYEVDQRS